MPARYRYAFDNEGRLLAVDELHPRDRRARGPFTCLGCGRTLTPKMGPIVVHHFAHLDTETCSGETYRHRLAKQVFHDTYVRCLGEKRPYTLGLARPRTCNHFQHDFGFTCRLPWPDEIDLTKHFDRVEIERRHAEFRADVLLWSSRTGDVLFVEFAATHLSTFEKRASGFRILEVGIDEELHAEELALCRVDGSSPRVRHFNFKDPRPASLCRGACTRPVELFVVHRDGTCELTQASAADVSSRVAAPEALRMEIIHSAAQESDVAMLKRKAREAAFDGIRVTDCFLCRFHGIDDFGAGPIYCKRLRKSCDSTAAGNCQHYWRMKSPAECAEVDARNEAWLDAREKMREKRRAAWERAALARRTTAPLRLNENARRSFLDHEAEWKRTHPRPQPVERLPSTAVPLAADAPPPEIPAQHDLPL